MDRDLADADEGLGPFAEALALAPEAYRVFARDLFARNAAVKLLLDPRDGRIVDASPSAAAFYGYPTDALRRMRIDELNQLPAELVAEEMERARTERRAYFEFKHRLASGEIRDVQVYSAPCRLGERELLFSIVCDITEQKRLASSLEHAQRMESLGRLAGGVAHDFNNLLTAAEMLVGLVRKRSARGEPTSAELDDLAAVLSRGGALTQQLLAFCRKQPMHPVLVDLRDVFSQLERLLSHHVAIELRFEACEGATVVADRTQLEQALLNVALNARDAMPSGGRFAMTTRLERVERAAAASLAVPEGEYVVIESRDDGVGIAKEHLSKIFEPFFSTKPRGHGTGLGLATAYGFVRQSGGTITVESAPGRGARFEIFLPRARILADAREANAPEPVVAGEGGGELVLVVDDDGSVRRTTVAHLVDAGYRVLAARDGIEALERARSSPHRIDLLLTDVVMSRMGGVELAEILARERPDLRVLFISGHVDTPAIERGLLAASHRFLAKPYSPERLLATVRSVLDGPVRAPSRDGA